MAKYQDPELKKFDLENFQGGFNSYSGGKRTVKDNEFPYGLNVVLDNNGSATKRSGSLVYGAEISAGKAIRGLGWLYNATHNKLIVAAGTTWNYNDGSTTAALTGMAFTDDKQTDFCQAIDRLYGANGADNLAYTTDGAAVTEVTANGNVGRWPLYYNQRLYMTNTTYKDRIYYSNPITATESSYAVGNFGTFDTNLSATPKKNAGFIILIPGGGVEITRIWKDNTSGTEYVYAYTKRHGIWRLTASSTPNTDGSINHSIVQIITSNGTPSGQSIVKVANDQWFFGGDNFYTYGESAQYQNLRLTTKSGRIRTEVNAIADKSTVCGGFYKDKIYFSYMAGTYNDRVLVYDVKMNAWGSPLQGINANCFLEFEGSDGVTRFLSGSSNSADSYVYQLEQGSNDVSTAINGYFETKSTDCGTKLKKYFAFIDVYCTMVFGTLTYEVFIDEVSSITGQVQIGNSSDKPAGLGSLPFGSFMIGAEYDANTTSATLQQNSQFRIECNYATGKTISVRFTNNVTGEQFKVDGLSVYFDPAESPYDE